MKLKNQSGCSHAVAKDYVWHGDALETFDVQLVTTYSSETDGSDQKRSSLLIHLLHWIVGVFFFLGQQDVNQ